MDGTLKDAVWANAPWTDDFVDIEGDANSKPRFRTRTKMLWDDDCLYIGADMEEPEVWATLTKRDSVIFHDNDFEVFIDPDGDNHNYFELEINALNTVWDLRLPTPYRDGGSAINSWDITGLKTAVQVDGKMNDPRHKDNGWSVEIAIPWSALAEHAGCQCPPKDGDVWRLNFSRVEWKVDTIDGKITKHPETPEDNWVWSPQGAIDMHRPERWGYVQFSDKTSGAVARVDDPTYEAREALHKLYYAQKKYFLKHGYWAGKREQLGTQDQRIVLTPVKDGYTAGILIDGGDGAKISVSIRQDSLVSVERLPKGGLQVGDEARAI